MTSHNRSFAKGFEKVATVYSVTPEEWYSFAGHHLTSGGVPIKDKKKRLIVSTGEIPGGEKFIHKTAAPAWFYEMNRTMNRGKTKNFSAVGLKNMKAAKGLK